MKITKKFSGESILNDWDIRRIKRRLAEEVIARYRNTLSRKGMDIGLQDRYERLVARKVKIEIVASVTVTNKELDRI